MVKVKTTGKTICLWCGKNHRKTKPAKCAKLSRVMSAVCNKVEVWKAFAVMHKFGTNGLFQLASELNIKVK